MDTSLHPAMRFDIYTDGLVVMLVYGVEVARKKLRVTLKQYIFRGFAEELAAYGIGIAPMGELREYRERIESLEKEVGRLKKGRKK